MSETQFFARGPSGKFDVPIDESEMNKQIASRPPERLPEEYSSPYLVPESIYEKAGRMALLGQTASLPPLRTMNVDILGGDIKQEAA